jgi:hypothetical protein
MEQRKAVVKDSGKNGGETIRDKKLRIEWCVVDTCDPDGRTCYCCQTLPNQPCYFDQHKCWDVCPGGYPPPAELVLAPPSSADRQKVILAPASSSLV